MTSKMDAKKTCFICWEPIGENYYSYYGLNGKKEYNCDRHCHEKAFRVFKYSVFCLNSLDLRVSGPSHMIRCRAMDDVQNGMTEAEKEEIRKLALQMYTGR